MKKQITAYRAYLDEELAQAQGSAALRLLEQYELRLADFKHERLIHLLVTLFFAGATLLLLLFTVALAPASLAGDPGLAPHVGIGLVLLLLIFLIVDVFYVSYYFFLENSLQQLYTYRDRLWRAAAS
ncbi:MAG: hypothetical protein LBU07_01970 [Coriobacteriales bacterium]|jgi:hypothetical protein|nr:hypothetical protein [Coriobacteriales bacterium]